MENMNKFEKIMLWLNYKLEHNVVEDTLKLIIDWIHSKLNFYAVVYALIGLIIMFGGTYLTFTYFDLDSKLGFILFSIILVISALFITVARFANYE